MIANLQKLFIANLSVLERGTSKVTPEHITSPGNVNILRNIHSINHQILPLNIDNQSSTSLTLTTAASSTTPSEATASTTTTNTTAATTVLVLLPSNKRSLNHNKIQKMTQAQSDVPNYNYEVNIEHLKEGAMKVVSFIRPDWLPEEMCCKIFTDGITNRLIGVCHISNKNDMILIRVYGENTDLFIDRAMELRNMRIMHKAGLSPQVYCSFNNGISYGYSPGMVLNSSSVRDDTISGLIAETMARMHTLSPPRLPANQDYQLKAASEASLFPGINKFLVLISSAFPVAKGCKKLKSICNIDKLDLEVFFLERELRRINSPIVFCHNDLLLKNIIYHEPDNRVSFIDFEYSDYNYQAFDIANHFCEFCGVDDFDPQQYPTKEFQIKWLKRYLTKWYQLTGNTNRIDDNKQFDDDVEKLYDAVNKFSLAAHLYWGLWALVQATNSSIDFDYLNFAQKRIDEYFRRKEILFEDECTCRLSAHNGDVSF